MALYQVVMRTGWIFKTESVIMPAVLDSLGASGWLRGFLPIINRFGQSVPPLLMSRRIKNLSQKKWALVVCTLLMSTAFLTLSAVWRNEMSKWLALIFLALYFLFFVSTGINQLAFGTLQGKLVQTTHRGRLLLLANLVGAASAISFAAWLLPYWLRPESVAFRPMFAFTGVCFLGSAAISLLLSEPKDNYHQVANGISHLFRGAWKTLRDDTNFRRLGTIAALFGSSLMLFPHYQSLGRGGGEGMQWDRLIFWVIVQNIGTALFSMLAGPLADWKGNRLVLRFFLLGICGAPLLAILLTYWGQNMHFFYTVFALVGLTPVCFKIIHNYTLEISLPEDHPRYLSTLSLCLGAPMFFSPLAGYLVDLVGFKLVFFGVTLLVLSGWLLTFGLREPRHHISPPPLASITGE